MTGPVAVRIGISGWTYPPWRGAFYPKGLTRKRELSYAAASFASIEINGTFYGLQRPDTFARWAQQVPEGFVFAVKGPRYVTHELRLVDCAVPLANFFASGTLRLGAKLGPILWQFPPSLPFEPARVAAFVATLPTSHRQAADLAAGHDDHLGAPGWLEPLVEAPLRHAVEVRHPSFRDRRFIDLLSAHGVALVCADAVDWPRWMDLTADFAYVRLHGSQELYASSYDDAELERWAGRIRAWSGGQPMRDGDFITEPVDDGHARDIYVYFDNTMKPHAPRNALALIDRLDLDAGIRR